MRALPTLLCLAAILLGPWVLPPFVITLADYVGLAAIVVLGLVLIGGVGSLMSFGQASFVGIGAYATAYLTLTYGVSPWLTLFASIGIATAVALVLGLVTLRLRGFYLPIGTLAWGIALYYLFANSDWLGSNNGLANVPHLAAFGYTFETPAAFFTLIWGVALLALVSIQNILDSRFGRAVRAGGRATPLAETFGIDTSRTNLWIFCYAAALAAVSGWLYAHFLRFVNPTPFSLSASIEYFFMAVIGGASSVWGGLAGAGLYIVLKQWLQTLIPALTGRAGQFDIVVFGLLVIVLMHHARQGLVPLLAGLVPRRPHHRPIADALPAQALQVSALPADLLVVQGATKRFGGLVAVNDVSFTVRAGEIVALIGPNGAGKSTLFNLITGVLPAGDGAVTFRGERLDQLPCRQVVQRGVARTFQHALLRPQMTVLENVALGAHRRGRAGLIASALRLDGAEEGRILAEARAQLVRVGLGDQLSTLAENLPLGQQRLVEIARALATDPALLLLDEPAAGLRYEEKMALARLLGELRAGGMTILLVEHDMDFVMNLIDHAVVMEFGQKIAEGTPQDIRANRRVIDAYLGGSSPCEPLKHAV